MTELIRAQAFDVITMGSCGMILSALAQLLNWYQGRRRPNRVIMFFQDLLYWFLSGLLAAAFLYYCSYGKLSAHALAALAAGALLWSFFLSKKITFFAGSFCDIIRPSQRG